jgi:membrane protein CcdC involved in cytochrome C biogenesis
MQPIAIATSLVGASAVLAWRLRETRRPLTVRKIVIPPLAMSTGLSMFAYAPARVPLTWALAAFASGALLLSAALIKTSQLTVVGDVVMLRRSRAFLAILLGLVAVRLAARAYVERYVNTVQTGSLFFLLAFGMIVTWRCWMFVHYRRLRAGMRANSQPARDS